MAKRARSFSPDEEMPNKRPAVDVTDLSSEFERLTTKFIPTTPKRPITPISDEPHNNHPPCIHLARLKMKDRLAAGAAALEEMMEEDNSEEDLEIEMDSGCKWD
jgi:hypothetical protein